MAEHATNPNFLTVDAVATEIGMSADGVRKLIQRGKLKAVKLSERNTRIPRLALEAYQRQINGGEAPTLTLPEPDPSSVSPGDLGDPAGRLAARAGVADDPTLAEKTFLGYAPGSPQSEPMAAGTILVGREESAEPTTIDSIVEAFTKQVGVSPDEMFAKWQNGLPIEDTEEGIGQAVKALLLHKPADGKAIVESEHGQEIVALLLAPGSAPRSR